MSVFDLVPSVGTARIATNVSHFLAEGVIWDPVRGKVLWVDTMSGAVYSGGFVYGGAIHIDDRIDFPDTAGAVAVSVSGDVLVAGTHRLYHRTPEGSIAAGPELIAGQGRRFNDGKPDPSGRFLVGTAGPGPELLLSVRGEVAAVLDDDLTLSNGLTWSSDGRRLFSVDTLSRCIYARNYDPTDGSTGAREIFTQFDHGYPDGATTDAEDHLWVAMWGAGCVIRISPDGEIVSRVDVPAPHVSCVTFAGPDLETLVITTATEGLDYEELREFPLSGRLFSMKPGVRGLEPHMWKAPASSAL